jgi:hypothetical protein
LSLLGLEENTPISGRCKVPQIVNQVGEHNSDFTWVSGRYSKIGGLFFAPFDDFDGQILSIPIISILVGGFNHLEKY